MALIKCEDCGKEFSDKASACPNCGCPITKETKKVTFHREYNWHGNLLKYGILVDGKEIGGVNANESVELDLELGKHTIVVNQFSSNGGIYHSCSKTIEIKENSENITINIGVSKFNIWKDLMGQSNLLEITSITGENITIS